MPPVLSIDFGSAFTKVALRREPDEPSKVLNEPTLNLDPLNFCIPTIAASVVRSGATRWVFGVDAAGLISGNGIRVYRNWKPRCSASAPRPPPTLVPTAASDGSGDGGAALASGESVIDDFIANLSAKSQERALLIDEIASRTGVTAQEVEAEANRRKFTVDELRRVVARLRPPTPRATGEKDAPIDVQDVAVHYFRWLRDFLSKPCQKYTNVELTKIPLRVCVPAFGTSGRLNQPSPAESVLFWVLRKAGWAVQESHPLVPEPYANAIGWLTEGVNKLTPVLNGRERMPDWEKMVGSGAYLNALQKSGSYRKGGITKHVILVVDVGAYTTDYAALDFDIDDMEVPRHVVNHSDPLGIGDLDDAVQAVLPPAVGDWFAKTDVKRREDFKSRAYADKSVVVTEVGEIGPTVLQSVREVIRVFAERIRERVVHFLDERGFRRIQEVILTGGGMNIPQIQSALVDGLRKRGVMDFHLPRPKGDLQGVFDQLLLRGAGALGGASVYFDYLA